ncbi:MAG: ycgJ 1 [Cyanobacteria bacterium RYN_339]|nr:ycgJ 1 [Cyanobacteria bacterium RYN_339]
MSWLIDSGFQGDRALDVGTGSGRVAQELAATYREVVGIDRTVDRAAPHPGVTFLAMDAERLDFPDASFDLVSISWALHHLENPTAVLLEMERVLKPGGRFLITEPFVAQTGTNQDLHLAAHQLLGEADRLRGTAHFPVFERLQIGSVIQGLNLVDLHYDPLMAVPEELDWAAETCREAAAPWIKKLTAEDFPSPLQSRAKALVERLAADGIRTSPAMRTYGTKVRPRLSSPDQKQGNS